MFGLQELQVVGNGQQLSTRDEIIVAMEDTFDVSIITDKFLNTLVSDNSKRNYKGSIEYFFKWRYGFMPRTPKQLFNIEPVDAIAYSEELIEMVMDEEIKISTYNYRILGVKKFYEWLCGISVINSKGIRLITENPFATIKQRSARDKEGSEELSEVEIYQLLKQPYGADEHIKERNKLILELAIETGIRNSALMKITRDNVTTIDGVKVIKTLDKGSKLAVRPITEYYDRLIAWYDEDLKLRKSDNGTIFNIHPVNANIMLKDWCKSVGITSKKITFHSLRTTTINLVFKRTDNNIGETQKAVGHTHSDTTMGYLEKTKKVNMVTNNLLGKIKEGGEFYARIQSMNKEELISLLMDLPLEMKEYIVKSWGN